MRNSIFISHMLVLAVLFFVVGVAHSSSSSQPITNFECASNSSTCGKDCQSLINLMVESRPQGFSGWAVRHPSLSNLYTEHKCEVCVEIGVARGELAYHLMKSVPSIREYHAVDPFLGGYDTRDAMSEELKKANSSLHWKEAILRIESEFGCKFRMHHGLSQDVAHHFPKDSVDCLFIDGDHTRNGVARDIYHYVPMVRPGGIIIFDDVHPRTFPGVVQAFTEFLKLNPGRIGMRRINTHNNYYVQRPSDDTPLDVSALKTD